MCAVPAASTRVCGNLPAWESPIGCGGGGGRVCGAWRGPAVGGGGEGRAGGGGRGGGGGGRSRGGGGALHVEPASPRRPGSLSRPRVWGGPCSPASEPRSARGKPNPFTLPSSAQPHGETATRTAT